jgi:predicted transcriptional regulator
MRVKKVKVGIRNLKEILKDTASVMKRVEKGDRFKPVKEPEIYFTNFEALRKALTPKRLELLHIIKTKKPSSINELARMAKRNVKNIAEDVKYLEQIGLIEKKETDNKTTPIINYDRIALEIAV